ncbi:UNVERIFIED_CONTAM: hypothetical protein HDU68_000687 [Siphonaria sp. JEL0065]|nr:hypothetical protein HDU68_000687 [Siphonaria sp. JEL0065]
MQPFIVSYWANPNSYQLIPRGAYAVINPANGILNLTTPYPHALLDTVPDYRRSFDNLSARGVITLGYVPLGHFNYTCTTQVPGECTNLIIAEAQIAAYYKEFPGLGGITFDEATPSTWECDAFKREYARARAIVAKYTPRAKIFWNPGVASVCPVQGSMPGEIVGIFEDTYHIFTLDIENRSIKDAVDEGKKLGVETQVTIHTCTEGNLTAAFNASEQIKVDYFYATQYTLWTTAQGGVGINTWGQPPKYFDKELALFNLKMGEVDPTYGLNSSSLAATVNSNVTVGQPISTTHDNQVPAGALSKEFLIASIASAVPVVLALVFSIIYVRWRRRNLAMKARLEELEFLHASSGLLTSNLEAN